MTATTAAAAAGQLGQQPTDQDKPDSDDVRLWSVTSLLDVLGSEGLIFWACERVAEQAVAWADTLPQRLQEDGYDQVVKQLRDSRFRARKDQLSDSKLGTCWHTAAEEYALSGARPTRDRLEQLVHAQAPDGFEAVEAEAQVLARMLDQFDGWLQRFQPRYTATEVCVYSPTYGYAGTTDAFLQLDDADGQPVRFIADYKSTRKPWTRQGKAKVPYPDTALQLAAYRHAELAAVWRPRRTEQFRRRYYLLGEAERAMAVPVPEVDGALQVTVTPEWCEAWPLRADHEVHRAFLHVLEVARFQNETAKRVVGDMLVPPQGGGA